MRRILPGTLALLAAFALIGLGVWQLERRVWKLDLIAHTQQRLHAAPIPTPDPASWPTLTKADAYTRLTASGHFLKDAETPVLAVTNLGRGYWILTPFQTDTGFTILINRGFVPTEKRDPATRPEPPLTNPTTVTGLLRLTEPHGAFLHTNNPTQNRWYSRDVAAIATTRHLTNTAPYFIDADATSTPNTPVGGLTVVTFPNNHLVYALTWFTLALMAAAMAFKLFMKKK